MRLNSPEAQPLIGGPYRRSCEENLARMAWASSKLREKPAAEQLATLLHFPGVDTRPLYAREARMALKKGCPVAQARALTGLLEETERLRLVRQQSRAYAPKLF